METEVHGLRMQNINKNKEFDKNKLYQRIQQLTDEKNYLVNTNASLDTVINSPNFKNPNAEILKLLQEKEKQKLLIQQKEEKIKLQTEINNLQAQQVQIPIKEYEALTKNHPKEMKAKEIEKLNLQ